VPLHTTNLSEALVIGLQQSVAKGSGLGCPILVRIALRLPNFGADAWGNGFRGPV
jgi:hypothetical protein